MHALSAEEWVALLVALGRLLYKEWLLRLPSDEAVGLQERASAYRSRLSSVLASQDSTKVQRRLGLGIATVVARMESARNEAREFVNTGGPPFLTSYELEGSLFDPLDDLGYALILAEDLKVEFDSHTAARVEEFLLELRGLIPRLTDRLRREKDYFQTDARQFPARFWWRRIVPLE